MYFASKKKKVVIYLFTNGTCLSYETRQELTNRWCDSISFISLSQGNIANSKFFSHREICKKSIFLTKRSNQAGKLDGNRFVPSCYIDN